MTIKECIDLVDNVKPNQYSIEDKVAWLSFLDGIIIRDVLQTHEGYDGIYDEFVGYNPSRVGTKLIAEFPYDNLYPAYLKMKIDEENGETARYNNSVTMFNSYFDAYKKWYNKTHMPNCKNIMRIFTGVGNVPSSGCVFDPSKLAYKDGLSGIENITIEEVSDGE